MRCMTSAGPLAKRPPHMALAALRASEAGASGVGTPRVGPGLCFGLAVIR